MSGWFAGLRSDLWFNDIDWKDNIGGPLELSGHTDIVVLQPTLEGGYRFSLGEDWYVSPSLAFGFEINIVSKGADVGQGAIVLVGIGIGKRIGKK